MVIQSADRLPLTRSTVYAFVVNSMAFERRRLKAATGTDDDRGYPVDGREPPSCSTGPFGRATWVFRETFDIFRGRA